MNKRGALLALTIALGLTLRLYYLPQRGIIARDEAWYVYGIRGAVSGFQKTLEIQPALENQPDFEKISANNIAGKPAYLLPLWLSGLINGKWNYEHVLMLSATAGTLNILAIYWLCRAAKFKHETALIAALVASLSFVNLYFSRIGYPHSTLILIHTLALGFYMRESKNPSASLFAAGLLWGIGLSVHSSLILAMPGIALAEIYLYKTSHRNTAHFLKRSSGIAAGIALPLLGWEAAYALSASWLQSSSASLTGSFLGDIFRPATDSGINSNAAKNILFYSLALSGMEAPVSSLFFAAGVFTIWRSKEHTEAKIISLFFAANFVAFSLYPALYGRQIASLMPAWHVVTAVGVSATIEVILNQYPRAKRLAAEIFPAALALTYIYWALPLISPQQSGWAQAAEWIKQNGQESDLIFTTEISDAAILNYYLPGRVLLWEQNKPFPIPNAQWYVQNPTIRRAPMWKIIQPWTSARQNSKAFKDSWMTLRPHLSMSGDWLLIPWWRWSDMPTSYQSGVDDTIEIFSNRQ